MYSHSKLKSWRLTNLKLWSYKMNIHSKVIFCCCCRVGLHVHLFKQMYRMLLCCLFTSRRRLSKIIVSFSVTCTYDLLSCWEILYTYTHAHAHIHIHAHTQTSDDSVRIAHFSIGIFVMILHILNVRMSYFLRYTHYLLPLSLQFILAYAHAATHFDL